MGHKDVMGIVTRWLAGKGFNLLAWGIIQVEYYFSNSLVDYVFEHS